MRLISFYCLIVCSEDRSPLLLCGVLNLVMYGYVVLKIRIAFCKFEVECKRIAVINRVLERYRGAYLACVYILNIVSLK